MTDPTATDLLADLEQLGRERADAERARAEAMVTIAGLIAPARAAGHTVARIMEATGLSRQTIYDLSDRA